MKILILGGTGVMGNFLVNLLSPENEIYVTSRRQRVSKNNITYIQGNAHNFSFFTRTLDLFFWDCIIDFMHYSTEEFKNRYLYILKSTKQFIFISSSRVYADCTNRILETSPRLLEMTKDRQFLKTDDYALAKARQEDLLLNSKYKNYTIIRPYMTYYSQKLDLGFYPKELWLKRVIEGKAIIFPKNICDKYTTLTSGYDVALGIKSIIGKDSALGEIFHITQNRSIKWQDVLNIYKDELKKHGISMKCIYIENDDCYSYINWYDRQYNRQFNNDKINQYLPIEKFTDTPKGLSNSLDEFLQNIHYTKIDWRFYAHWDRITKETTKLKNIPGLKNKFVYLFFRYTLPYPALKKIKYIF